MVQSFYLIGLFLLQVFAISVVQSAVVPTSDGPDTCVDKLGFQTCRHYDQVKCDYEVYRPWALENCRRYCGYCTVPTTPKPCFDKIQHCNLYNNDLCTNPLYKIFVEDNCQKFCSLCGKYNNKTKRVERV